MALSSELVSVVVPAYNAAGTLDETLRSVRAQTHRALDIVVVDDGSTDATAAVAQAHMDADPRVRLIRQANGGVAAARNTGWRAARSDYIALIASDDLWAPAMLEKLLAAMQAGGSRIGVSYCFFTKIDAEGMAPPFHYPDPCTGDVLDKILLHNFVGCGSTMLVRREALLATDGFYDSLRAAGAQGCDDYLFCCRAAEHFHYACVPEVLVGYRDTPGGISSSAGRMLRSWMLVAEQMIARQPARRDLMRLLTIIGNPKWTTPALILLGLASSFAETMGITLILMFLYLAIGHAGHAGSGLVGRFVGVASRHFGSTSQLAWLILLLIVARGALATAYSRIGTNIGTGLSERACDAVHQQYLNVSYGFIQRHPQAALMEVLASETWEVATAYGSFTRVIINGCSIAVFALFLALVSWRIMAVAFIGSAVISAISRLFTGRARELGRKVKQTHEYLDLQMLMTIQGMRTIRAYGQEAAHQERFAYTSREAKEVTNAAARLSAWIGPITEVGYLGILCVIIAGSSWWHTSFAETLAAVALLYRLQPHTRELEDHMMHLAQSQPQLESVRAMLESADKSYAPQGHLPFQKVRERIEFRNVSFRYSEDAAYVLSDLTFDIPAGVTTALIGASGAGKTTVVNLLLRLYEPTSGTIFVDGIAINDLRREDWVRQMGLAGQDVELVEGTVMNNIRMADPLCEAEQAIAAARAAGVASFIEDLPDGYNTWIGPEGLRFSGGQRQRIGLARAILRNSDLLILDEAMSALDRGLEDKVKHEIDARLKSRTILVITHPLETLQDVQHVVWIDNGRIRGRGRPEAVLPEARQVLAPPDAMDAARIEELR